MAHVAECISECYELDENFSVLESGVCITQDETSVESEIWIEQEKNVWLVEPSLESYRTGRDRNLQILNFAISDHVGEVEFYSFKEVGWSYTNDAKNNDAKMNNGTLLDSYFVPCTTFENIQKIADVLFDIMILDIEGSESLVLKDMKKMDKTLLPKVMCIECGFDWQTREQLVKDLGYELDFYFENNAYFSIPNSIKKNHNNMLSRNLMWPKFIYNNEIIYINNAI